MFVREVVYYCMSQKQLDKEIERLRLKIESESDFDKKFEYIKALTDVVKTLIRKNRKNKKFMQDVRKTLNELQTQSEESMLES